MRRRHFLQTLALGPAACLQAQEGPPREEPVEKMTAGPKPAIALCHAGFRPETRKTVIYRLTGSTVPESFVMREIGSGPPFSIERPLRRADSGLGPALAGDFSDVSREGMYQVVIAGERSVPFFIRPDAWRRTLPMVVSYHKAQRCGVEIPNVHKACHLDDARRRDNGQYVDTTGGWHDAGDLRKWMSATMTNGFGLLYLARHLGAKWDLAGSGLAPLHEEVRWGNRYFLKMQDSDGRVWADVGGGLNGDNSDNHWTDNKPGNADDRYLNPSKPGLIQAMFTALQAMLSSELRASDPAYAGQCLKAAVRCWDANDHAGPTREFSWWVMAASELLHATRDQKYADALAGLATELTARQETQFIEGQKLVRGFFRMSPSNPEPYKDAVDSALPAIVLLQAARALPKHPAAAVWRDRFRLYLDDYVLPMTARSPYGLMPYGVFVGSPTPETFRPLAGKLTYRFFMQTRKQFWWQGLNAHLLQTAAALAMGAHEFGKKEYRDAAYRQPEWVLGANPFGSSLMTGEGLRQPYPHTRYVGLLPGGIMNGICGNPADEPILDLENGLNWRTTEYWSPHVAYYEWAHSLLEMPV